MGPSNPSTRGRSSSVWACCESDTFGYGLAGKTANDSDFLKNGSRPSKLHSASSENEPRAAYSELEARPQASRLMALDPPSIFPLQDTPSQWRFGCDMARQDACLGSAIDRLSTPAWGTDWKSQSNVAFPIPVRTTADEVGTRRYRQ
jgi:hypothetical protein